MKFIVDNEKKVIFGWSAKCGCSHIKKIFWYLKTNDENYEIHRKEEHGVLPDDVNHYTVIIIVRDPLERLVSGFLDKYRTWGEFRGNWRNKSITFENFVNALIANDFSQVDDHHFLPQTKENFDNDMLSKSKKVVVYDLKKIDYEFIEQLYNKKIPQTLIDFRGPHANNKTITLEKYVYALEMSEYEYFKVDTKYFYNDELTEKVREYFSKDIKFCKIFNINY